MDRSYPILGVYLIILNVHIKGTLSLSYLSPLCSHACVLAGRRLARVEDVDPRWFTSLMDRARGCRSLIIFEDLCPCYILYLLNEDPYDHDANDDIQRFFLFDAD